MVWKTSIGRAKVIKNVRAIVLKERGGGCLGFFIFV